MRQEQRHEDQAQLREILDQTLRTAERRREGDTEDAKIQWNKVPKYKQMEHNADLTNFLAGFEDHMASYMVQRCRWPMLLAPLLNEKVYHMFDPDAKKDYDAIRTKLNLRFHISEDNYRRKLEDLSKRPDETWTSLILHYGQLQTKWHEEYQVDVCQ